MKNTKALLLTACLTVLIAGVAGAQDGPWGTPDGVPPAFEEVCDGTVGAAHGLCVAFCEAMDCDSDDPQASEQACTRVGDRYIQITGELPPCLNVCPCWEADDLDSVTADNQLDPGFLSCTAGAFGSPLGLVIQNFNGSTPGVEGGFATAETGGAFFCATRDLPPFFLQITPEEFDACNAQIETRCEEIGTPIPFDGGDGGGDGGGSEPPA